MGQADVGAVDRLGGGVQEGHDPAAVALVVVGRVLDQVVVAGELDGAGRLPVDGVVYRVSLLQGGEQGEDLETRPGLAGALGDDVELGAAGPGPPTMARTLPVVGSMATMASWKPRLLAGCRGRWSARPSACMVGSRLV